MGCRPDPRGTVDLGEVVELLHLFVKGLDCKPLRLLEGHIHILIMALGRIRIIYCQEVEVLECTQTESRATKLEPQARWVSYH